MVQSLTDIIFGSLDDMQNVVHTDVLRVIMYNFVGYIDENGTSLSLPRTKKESDNDGSIIVLEK